MSVSLPLTRERHTGWPVVPGASLKGALRARAERLNCSDERIRDAFGDPPPNPGSADDPNEEGQAGRVGFGPATLLAMPVRGLFAPFTWVTCPMALGRFARVTGVGDTEIPSPGAEWAWFAPGCEEDVGFKHDELILDEVAWLARSHESVGAWSKVFGRWLQDDDAPLRRLVVVHDDVFSHAAQFWTETRTRAAIGADGVVADGKLFTVEFAPPETLWWSEVTHLIDDDAAVLPERAAAFPLGGHRSVGSGRACWYPPRSSQ